MRCLSFRSLSRSCTIQRCGQLRDTSQQRCILSHVAPPLIQEDPTTAASPLNTHQYVLSHLAPPPIQEGFDPIKAAAALKSHHYVLLKLGSQKTLTADAFSQMASRTWKAAGYKYEIGDYEGGTVQRSGQMLENQGCVYDVKAGAPSDRPVLPHCENAYLSYMPHFAAFACKRAADQGGELSLTDMRSVLQHLSSDVKEKCASSGITYIRRMGDRGDASWSYATGYWQDRFGTSNWEEAQQRAACDPWFGTSTGGLASLSWRENYAELTWRMSGFARPPSPEVASSGGCRKEMPLQLVMSILDSHASISKYGEESDVPALHSKWGDGTELTLNDIKAISDAYAEATRVQILMEPGDVVIVDNFCFAHGRESYHGPREHMAVFSEKVWRGTEVPNVKAD